MPLGGAWHKQKGKVVKVEQSFFLSVFLSFFSRRPHLDKTATVLCRSTVGLLGEGEGQISSNCGKTRWASVNAKREALRE